MFTPKGMRRQHSRLGNLSRSVIDSPIKQKTPVGTPGRSNEATSVPIKVYELLKSGDVISGILNGGIGVAITNDTIMLWRLSNTMKVYRLPIPANYACKPQNIAVVGTASVCFVSTTGTGRFWSSMEQPTKWAEFKIALDRDDLIQAVHGDKDKIGAVTSRGVLFNIYVQNGQVGFNTHRLPSKSKTGLVRRVSSIFWTSSQQDDQNEQHAKSLLVGGVFVICINDTVYGWDLTANAAQPRLVVPYADVFGAGATLESVAGNDKYVGFLVRVVEEETPEELHRLICPIDEFIVSPSSCDRAEIKLGGGVGQNERQDQLHLLLPYLAQVAVSTAKHVWLSNDKCVQEDTIQAAGAYDGQIALLTAKGLRLYKTQQRVESAQLLESSTVESTTQIAQLEQLAASERPGDRLAAAMAQYNQGNNAEAEQLLGTIGALDQVARAVSGELIDEIPVHDPRWSRSKLTQAAAASGQASSASLLIQRQLAEKQAKHRLLVNFLSDRLSDEALDALGQDGEKIELAARLRQAGTALQGPLDQAIRVVIQQRPHVTLQLGLTHQDLYYQKISETHHIVSVIAQLMANTIVNSKDRIGKVSFEAIELIQKMNSLIALIINACKSHRTAADNNGRRPWTTVLQEALIEIVQLNGDNNIPLAVPACVDELLVIAKFILQDRLEHHQANGEVDVLHEESEFGQLRQKLIDIFMQAECYGEAAVLSEQFHDFGTLLKLYERDGNDQKLGQYLELANFAAYIYKKYRGEKLVNLAARHGGQLAELVGADDQHGWLLSIRLSQLNKATEQLQEQAESRQSNSLSKRTLLSVAKLTAIAAGVDQAGLALIKEKEALLNYQDRLPDKLLHVAATTPALDCVDLIDAMTSGNVAQITLSNGRDALDMLSLLGDHHEREQMKALIWSRLIESEIASSTWKNALGNSHQPIEALRGTKFADLLSAADEDELPVVDELKQQTELADFGDNAVFDFIIGAAIEARRGELCEMSA